MLGETLGNFRIVEQLGAGGMGVVYRARDLRLERDVALKVIRPESASPALRAAFLREARLASSLNHPGIVTVHDIFDHDGMACIVMELVAGRSLGVEIPTAGLPLERVLRLGVRIGRALAAAHAAGVVHRDLKPANILVRPGDQIKILDFGLAKLVEGSTRDEAPTRVEASIFGDGLVGTLAFLAPESARGEAVDARADLFSFGAILHQMVCGRAAFGAPTPAAILHAVQTAQPAPLRQLCPSTPEALEVLVRRALAKPVAERCQSAAEMVEDLEEILAGRVPARTPPGPAPALPVPPPGASAKTSIAVLAFRSLSPDADNVYLASGLAAELTSALTGIPGLRIVSQRAAMQLPEATEPRQAGAALGARYVLAGSARRAGARVRVSAELVDTRAEADGGVVWSRNYDREITDMFAVQEDIARAIVKALGGELIRAASDYAFRAPSSSLDAWGLARKAYHVWNYEFSLEGVVQALGLLRRALELDPDYAYAHALLGFYLITTVINRLGSDPAARDEALRAAEHACRLAPDDPEVLECAAMVWQHTGQYERAVSALKRAVRLAPFDLVAWGYLGFAHACAGGPAQVAEARTILARLLADAPDHPSLAFWHQFTAIACLRQEDFPAAVEHGRMAVEMQPGFVFNQVFYAEALCRLQPVEPARVEEARAVLAGIRAYNPHFSLAMFEEVARHACRTPAAVDQLCGQIRARGLFPA